MLTGGGRSLEHLRALNNDSALGHLQKSCPIPSADAVGDWLRRSGTGAGLIGLDHINQRVIAVPIGATGVTAHTLGMEASQIIAEKATAQFTYQGEQGYMPMIAHLAEVGIVMHDAFREGNTAPASGNLAFIQACCARMSKGRTIAHVRIDSAGYQATIFNYCQDNGKTFAIGGRLHTPTQKAIADIPDAAWKQDADCAVAETLHSMNDTNQAFCHAGAWVLKVATAMVDLFHTLGKRSFALAAVPP